MTTDNEKELIDALELALSGLYAFEDYLKGQNDESKLWLASILAIQKIEHVLSKHSENTSKTA